MNLLIIGAGGHGRVVKEIAEALNLFERIEFVDDNGSLAIGKIDDLAKLRAGFDAAFIAIGNNQFRNKLLVQLEVLDYYIPTLIHPSAYISESAVIKKGTVVEPKAIVNANVCIDEGCIISVGSIIDHDSVLERCVHINAGAICKAGSHVTAETRIDAGMVVNGY